MLLRILGCGGSKVVRIDTPAALSLDALDGARRKQRLFIATPELCRLASDRSLPAAPAAL
jgi:hypothetical protein